MCVLKLDFCVNFESQIVQGKGSFPSVYSYVLG